MEARYLLQWGTGCSVSCCILGGLVFSRLQKAVRLSSLNYVLAVDSFRPLVGILLTSVACGAMCPVPARPSKGALSSLSASMWVSPC